MNSLDYIFNPKSIAVLGASRREEAVGHAVFKNILEGSYKGILYPVNPNASSIRGVRCYNSILDIPDSVDLAILVVPAIYSVAAFKECIKKKVKAAIVISAGFKEVGAEGLKLEKTITELAKKHKIPLIGPNCLGVINASHEVSLNATFGRSMPKSGKIGFVSQSGAMGTAVLDYAKGVNIGFSKFVSLGNKSCLSELEVLEYLSRDPETEVIIMYLEDLAHPREMINLCRKITGREKFSKPILAIKSGRTLQGAKAAASHTGSLAGSDDVYTAIFLQAGILRVDTVDELFDYAKAFSAGKMPNSNQVAIVTNAGGPGIMATDACVRYGLSMTQISEKTQKKLTSFLPPASSVANPVDILGDAQNDRYARALKLVLQERHVNGVIVILTPQAMTDIENIANVIGKIASKSKKPILACFMGIVDVSAGVAVLEKWHVPHYRFPESAAKAFGAMVRYTAWVKRPRTRFIKFRVKQKVVTSILKKATREKRLSLHDHETFSLLKAYGFPILPNQFCKTGEEAVLIAKKMGFPVVMKISSPDILHKVDVGGVKLNLQTPTDVRKAARELIANAKKSKPDARIRGFMVQKMAEKGREVILGLKRDPQFGPILMFGLGGTYVEVVKDVTFRIAPIRELGAYRMIESIKSIKILEGVRGEKRADIKKIAESILRLSQLATECPEIEELDINPLVVYGQSNGCMVLDARILISSAK